MANCHIHTASPHRGRGQIRPIRSLQGCIRTAVQVKFYLKSERKIMGSWWRSRDMKYVSLILSEDAAHECVLNLGQLGALQFTDLNPEQTPFQRRYVSYIKRYICNSIIVCDHQHRCDELERKLRYMCTEIDSFGLQVTLVFASNDSE